MTNEAEEQPTLPGLELGEHRGSLREAVVTTLAALKSDGLLEPRHAAVAQLALVLADAVQRGAQSAKPYSSAMVAAQLLAALEALPKPMEADVAQKFAELVDSLRESSSS